LSGKEKFKVWPAKTKADTILKKKGNLTVELNRKNDEEKL
jgi:hypothetical protein